MKVIEKLNESTLLCEIPDVDAKEVTLDYNGKTYKIELNENFADTFKGLREFGWEYVPVNVKEERDVVDSVLICKVPTHMPVLDFLTEYRESLFFEELWWIVKDDILYLFGWWD